MSANTVDGYNWTGVGSSTSFYNSSVPTASVGTLAIAQGTGVFSTCVDIGCNVANNTLASNDIGIIDEPVLFDQLHGNLVTGSHHFGVVVDGFPGGSAHLTGNTIRGATAHSVALLLDNGTFNVTGNFFGGTQATGSSGAGQLVCGPNAFLVCATDASTSTAAIEVVSESSAGPTTLYLGANSYNADNARLSTLAVNGGSVVVVRV